MIKYIVIYATEGMRERSFDNEKDAKEFALTVNGSVCPFVTKLTGKALKEQNRIKKFGYGV